jgi:hypothetical protein
VASRIAYASSGFSLGRPECLPCALALAMPTFTRSRIMSRSTSNRRRMASLCSARINSVAIMVGHDQASGASPDGLLDEPVERAFGRTNVRVDQS